MCFNPAAAESLTRPCIPDLGSSISALTPPVRCVAQAPPAVNLDRKNTCSATRSVRWPSLSFTVELVRSFNLDTPPPARPRDNTARTRLFHTRLGRARALVVLRSRSAPRSLVVLLQAGCRSSARRKPRVERWRWKWGGLRTSARRGGSCRTASCRDRPRPRESGSESARACFERRWFRGMRAE